PGATTGSRSPTATAGSGGSWSRRRGRRGAPAGCGTSVPTRGSTSPASRGAGPSSGSSGTRARTTGTCTGGGAGGGLRGAAGGEGRELVAAAGPQRGCGGMWHERAYAREYFRCLSGSGAVLWLFRDAREDDWYLHGWWD